jgi:hypothetical protein
MPKRKAEWERDNDRRKRQTNHNVRDKRRACQFLRKRTENMPSSNDGEVIMHMTTLFPQTFSSAPDTLRKDWKYITHAVKGSHHILQQVDDKK